MRGGVVIEGGLVLGVQVLGEVCGVVTRYSHSYSLIQVINLLAQTPLHVNSSPSHSPQTSLRLISIEGKSRAHGVRQAHRKCNACEAMKCHRSLDSASKRPSCLGKRRMRRQLRATRRRRSEQKHCFSWKPCLADSKLSMISRCEGTCSSCCACACSSTSRTYSSALSASFFILIILQPSYVQIIAQDFAASKQNQHSRCHSDEYKTILFYNGHLSICIEGLSYVLGLFSYVGPSPTFPTLRARLWIMMQAWLSKRQVQISSIKFENMQIDLDVAHTAGSALECAGAGVEKGSAEKGGAERREEGRRWVVVGLMGLSQLLMGLASNAVIPLEHKMTQVFGVSEGKVSTSIILSFLVFSLANFPANHIIDTRGLRVAFLAGTGLYTAGTLLYLLVARSYYFVIAGTVLMGVGQPFLMNSPAKVAAFWFFPKNRALATAIMVGTNILGVGVGFLVPALAVREESLGEAAKDEIHSLYRGYFLFSAACLLLNCLLMRSRPGVAPSEGAEAEKVASAVGALRQVAGEKNVLRFLVAYCLSYGSFIAFASNCNFIIKPYGYTDVEIATNAVLLMLVGTCGAIAFSVYIKRTYNFRLALRTIAVASVAALLLLCLWLNTANAKLGTSLIISALGFVLTPLVPLSYDLGCELAFPLGEAQVTGLLNGGALLWAFLASTFLANTVGFSSGHSSLLTMVILSAFILAGAVLFFGVRIELKRHEYEGRAVLPKNEERDTASSSNGYITFPDDIEASLPSIV